MIPHIPMQAIQAGLSEAPSPFPMQAIANAQAGVSEAPSPFPMQAIANAQAGLSEVKLEVADFSALQSINYLQQVRAATV